MQAALNYWNAEENALTRMFTLEYSFWFDYMLPGLEALRLPIPLGGTSNHFRTQPLRDLGGWDPYNVTEDADLGIRPPRSATPSASLIPPRTRRRTGPTATGSGSAPGGSRVTCRPRSCTPVAR